MYTSKRKRWGSVTPVFLAGHHEKNYKRIEKLLRRAIVQAGYSLDDLADYAVQQAPFFKAAKHAREYRVPKYLNLCNTMTALHVAIEWNEAVSGPIAIGAGRHLGLGLFAPQ